MNSRFVELHILQNFAPSCLNRDDTNSPKDCEFGGYRRARISSQCLKRAIRTSPVFEQTVGGAVGKRTRLATGELARLLRDRGKSEEEAASLAAEAISAIAKPASGQPERSSVLLFLGRDELERIAELVTQHGKDWRKTPEAKALRPKSADIALFGRMVAENADMNIDAACQVAHAISTNRLTQELDYWTAVDDLQPEDEPGAGMIGYAGFNSCCFYRYAAISVPQLLENLEQDQALAAKSVEGFLRASIAAVPTGKQNSFAAHNPPEMVLAVVRSSGQPVSLANAFAKPVEPGRDGDLISRSALALDRYWGELEAMYGLRQGIVAHPWCLRDRSVELEALREGRKESIEDLISSVMEAL